MDAWYAVTCRSLLKCSSKKLYRLLIPVQVVHSYTSTLQNKRIRGECSMYRENFVVVVTDIYRGRCEETTLFGISLYQNLVNISPWVKWFSFSLTQIRWKQSWVHKHTKQPGSWFYISHRDMIMQWATWFVDIDVKVLKIHGIWDKNNFIVMAPEATSKWPKVTEGQWRHHRLPLIIDAGFLATHAWNESHSVPPNKLGMCYGWAIHMVAIVWYQLNFKPIFWLDTSKASDWLSKWFVSLRWVKGTENEVFVSLFCCQMEPMAFMRRWLHELRQDMYT